MSLGGALWWGSGLYWACVLDGGGGGHVRGLGVLVSGRVLGLHHEVQLEAAVGVLALLGLAHQPVGRHPPLTLDLELAALLHLEGVEGGEQLRRAGAHVDLQRLAVTLHPGHQAYNKQYSAHNQNQKQGLTVITRLLDYWTSRNCAHCTIASICV